MSMILDDLSKRLYPILKQHGVKRAIIFGSLARGDESRRSDLDLIVVQETEKRFLDRYDDLLPAIVAVVPERDVDLFIYTPQELEVMAKRDFIARALREGKVIYESE